MPHWPHAPIHRLAEAGTFIVTAGTYQKLSVFAGDERLKALHDGLLKYAKKHQWQLEAWAVFPNHYHFVGHSPAGSAESLSPFIADFHQHSTAWVNTLDPDSRGRKVWHNYWETRLTHERSYLARLNYLRSGANLYDKICAVLGGLLPHIWISPCHPCSALPCCSLHSSPLRSPRRKRRLATPK